jgi:hypothetical protein
VPHDLPRLLDDLPDCVISGAEEVDLDTLGGQSGLKRVQPEFEVRDRQVLTVISKTTYRAIASR